MHADTSATRMEPREELLPSGTNGTQSGLNKENNLHSLNSPLKMKVEVDTARKLHIQPTPREQQEMNYMYGARSVDDNTTHANANWFFATPQKQDKEKMVGNVAKYDDVYSVHSSGGTAATTDESLIDSPTALPTDRNHVPIPYSEKNYARRTTASMGVTVDRKNYSKEGVAAPLFNLTETVASNTNPLKETAKYVNSNLHKGIHPFQSVVVPKPNKVIKKTVSMAPIQNLILQKHYKDAILIGLWLQQAYEITLIPPFILPRDSKENSLEQEITIPTVESLPETMTESISIAYGKHAFDSLARVHDGVLLLKLCMKVFNMNAIPGTTFTPKSNAHKLQNIRKALECICANNKKVSINNIMSKEDDINKGNCNIILELLVTLKKYLSSN